jgi:hypothetical protein
MKAETVTITKEEYKELKRMAEVDEELLENLVKGLKAIREGKVRRVR